MEKLIYAFIVSIIIGILSSGFSVALSIKVINAIFVGVLMSDILLLGFYMPNLISNTDDSDLNYVFVYIIISFLFYMIYIPYVLVRNNGNCICKSLRCSEYSYLDSLSEQNQ